MGRLSEAQLLCGWRVVWKHVTAQDIIYSMERNKMRDHRRWLAIPVLLWAVVQLIAAVNAFRTPEALAVGMAVHPFIIGGLALTWAALFGVAGGMLIGRRPSALAWTARLLVAFAAVNTARFVLFAQADYARGRLPFQVIANTLTVLIALIYLVARHKRQRGSSDGDNHS